MKVLVMALAANQTVTFDIAGSYFEIIDSVGAITVAFTDTKGSQLSDMQLDSVLSGFYVNGAFARFQVTEKTGVAQSVTIAYGANTGGSKRSPGTVRVIDQGADKTSAGNQFFCGTYSGPDATKCGLVGFMAGAKPLYIKRLAIGCTLGTRMRLFTSTGAPTDTASSAPLKNKLLGGADAAAVRWQGLAVADPPTTTELPGNVPLGYFLVQQNAMLEIPLTTPIRVPANTGFFAMSITGSTGVYMSADCEE